MEKRFIEEEQVTRKNAF